LSIIPQIQALVRNGLYYLTEHALDEATDDGFDLQCRTWHPDRWDSQNLAEAGQVRSGGWPGAGWASYRGCMPHHLNPQGLGYPSLRGSTVRMGKGEAAMSFWEGETCEYCGGTIVEKRVALHRKVNGKYLVTVHIFSSSPPAAKTKRSLRYILHGAVSSVGFRYPISTSGDRAFSSPSALVGDHQTPFG